MKKITPINILTDNQKLPGNIFNGKIFIKGNQPPKKRIAENVLINSIFAYSPKKNNAKVIAEYSTLYPETNSASASGKSKGCRFVSAKEVIKKIKKNWKKRKCVSNRILTFYNHCVI